MKKIEMVGRVFNNWKILKETKRKCMKRRFLALCILCETKHEVYGESVRNGRSTKCVDCGNEQSGKSRRGKSLVKEHELEDRKIKYILKRYKSDARNRKNRQDWNLTEEQFKKLIKSNCYYCNIPPNTRLNLYPPSRKVTQELRDRGWILYNGIDRVDNKKDYSISNVVTCCKLCNRMKSNLTKEEFLNHIHRIYKTGQTSDQYK